MRKLARRLKEELTIDATVWKEYRSPVRSIVNIDGEEASLDIFDLKEDPDYAEKVITKLALQKGKARTKTKQLDALFYGLFD